jgi:hypothetical protein
MAVGEVVPQLSEGTDARARDCLGIRSGIRGGLRNLSACGTALIFLPHLFSTALVYRRAVGDGSASNPLGDAVPNPGASRACAFGLAVNAIPFNIP